jgi:hypothetical protein
MFRKCFAFPGLRISVRVALVILTIAAACSVSVYGVTPVVTVTASATTVDGTDTAHLTAVVTNDTGADGVTWQVSGGGVLSLTTTTSATYTAPAASSAPLTITVTATSVADTSVTGTATLTVPAAPKVTTTTLAAGAVGTAYSQTLTASGGIAPYTYSVASGTLSACLKLSTAGAISGTPTASCVGTAPLTFKVTDSGKSTALTATSSSLSLVIAAAKTIALPAPATLPAGTYKVAYTGSATATGGAGALTYSLTAGAVPTGLAFHTSSGAINGTPTAVGTFDFTVKAVDAFGDSASQAYSIIVSYAPIKVTVSTLPIGYVESSYTRQLYATGGTGTGETWVLSGSTALPAGLSLSTTGEITGTATGPNGKTSFTVTVTDSNSDTGSGSFSITVYPTLSITSSTPLKTGYEGTSYSKQLTAVGGTGDYKWSTNAAGTTSLATVNLTLSSAGLITGTPAAAATASFTVTTTDSNGHAAAKAFTLVVTDALTITTTTLPGAYTGTAYSQTLVAAAGTQTGYAWTLSSAGNLATFGLSLSSAGVLSGTPAVTGTASFTAKVTDSGSNMATEALTLKVYAPLALPTPNPSSLSAAVLNTSYTGSVIATGGVSAYTWTVGSTAVPTNGTLVALSNGLSASNKGTATLSITGTPTTTTAVSFTAKVKDSVGNTVTQTYTIAVNGPLSITTTALPAAFTGSLYSQTLVASGGTGTGYTWTATSSNLSTYGLTLSTAGVLSGTPSVTGTASFTANVADSASHTATQPLTVTVNAGLALPAPNPVTLPSGTVSQSYTGSINATGGVSPYAWTVAGHAIPATGTAVAISDGITVSSNGSNILTVAGTPTTAETVTLATSVTDSASHTAGPVSYTIVVNGTGSSLTGQIFFSSGCGGDTSIPPITITINTTPAQHTTNASNGTFTFSGLPSGTFTLTPSITGPTSVFYPATQSVTLNGTPVSGKNFSVSLGYTVSGNVTYAGVQTGQVYVVLESSDCGGGNGNGISMTEAALTSGGAYTIRGVPPGDYTLTAGMDTLGQGVTNDIDPTGNASLTVSSANVTGADVAMTDPAVTTPSSGPQIGTIAPSNLGVVLTYNALRDSDGIEEVSGYTVEWSTTSTFAAITSKSFPAVGKNAPFWILNNGVSGLSGVFTNGTSYYFRARGELSNATVHTPWTVWGGSTPTAVKVDPPSSSGMYTVTGTVAIPSAITPTGPLYVGFYNQDTGLSYSTSIASPSNSTPNAYTVYVPDASATYIAFDILDQNNNGVIDVGDITNINDSSNASSPTVTITGSTSGENLTLPSVASVANTTTQYLNIINSGGTSTSYDISFDVRGQNKLPVAVALTSASNHNVIYPLDIGACLSGCGHAEWDYNAGIATAVPNVGDTYTFSVTYSDGTTGTVVGTVSAVLTASNLPTNLQPNGTDSTSVTPTFTWTDPANASSYVYSFYLCCGSNGNIWQIPGNDSQLEGFASTITSIVWGTDPTGDSSNIPSVGDLTPGTNYSWTIQLEDSNGNQAQTQVSYTP